MLFFKKSPSHLDKLIMSIELLTASVTKLTDDLALLITADKDKSAKIVALEAQVAELTASSNPAAIESLTAQIDTADSAVNAELAPVVA